MRSSSFILRKLIAFFSPVFYRTMALAVVLLINDRAKAQAGFYVPDELQLERIQRIEMASGSLFKHHLGIYPYSRQTNTEELLRIKDKGLNGLEHLINQSLWENTTYLSETEHERLLATRIKKPLWGLFYKDGRHFYSTRQKHFTLTLDPLLQLHWGKEKDNRDDLYLNQRGLRIESTIDQKVAVKIDIIETQQTANHHLLDYESLYKAFPGSGLYKEYSGRILKLNRGFDYLKAESEISVQASKHIAVSLGHGRHFVGYGINSLLLSDFAAPYFYLRLNTNVGRIHYQNIIAELSAGTLGNEGDRLLTKKYLAAHTLSIQLTKRWEIGLFESVVFSRENHFELQYLNPVILYRFVEHALGSPDNVMMGFQSKLLFGKKYALYGQLMFDEFLLKEIIKQRGWWGNKYGLQLGFKCIDFFGIQNLDLQTEFNLVRPYTYTYKDSIANYSHFNQGLAHPLGANFLESRTKFHYPISQNLMIDLEASFYQKGIDTSEVNYGGNILLDYNTRIGDLDNKLLQGQKSIVVQMDLAVSYRLWPQTWIQMQTHFRQQVLEGKRTDTPWFSIGVRMGLDRQKFNF